jgi:hypothetical protein
MFISTREMLGQVGNRSADEERVGDYLAAIELTGKLSEDGTLGPILKELGPEALSDKALRMLAAALDTRRHVRPAKMSNLDYLSKSSN